MKKNQVDKCDSEENKKQGQKVKARETVSDEGNGPTGRDVTERINFFPVKERNFTVLKANLNITVKELLNFLPQSTNQ